MNRSLLQWHPAFQAVMQIELAAILLLVAAYLFIVGCSIYYRSKYEKEM